MQTDSDLFKVGSQNVLAAIIAEKYLTLKYEQVRVSCIKTLSLIK